MGEKTQAWQNEALLYPSALHRSHCEMTMSSLLVNRQSFQGPDGSVEPDSVPSTGVVLGLQLWATGKVVSVSAHSPQGGQACAGQLRALGGRWMGHWRVGKGFGGSPQMGL